MRGGAPFDPLLFPGAAFYVDTSRSVITRANVVSGTGVSLAKSVDTITLSGAAGLVASHAGGTIYLSGYGAGNNGAFTLLTATTGGGTFTNAAGASESGSGSKTWAVDGQCSGITDLVSGATLTQTGPITDQMAVCTTDNPSGKPTIGSNQSSSTRWLTIDSTAVAGKLNGGGPATWFARFQCRNFSGFGWTPIQHRDTALGTTPASYAAFQTAITATTGRNLTLYQAASAGTTFGLAVTTTFNVGQWYSLACIYDGNVNADWYVDGGFVATTVNSPVRTLIALRSVTIGMFSQAGAGPGSIGGGKIAGLGTWKANLGATRIAALHAYFSGWQP